MGDIGGAKHMVKNLAIVEIDHAVDGGNCLVFEQFGHSRIFKIADTIIEMDSVEEARILDGV